MLIGNKNLIRLLAGIDTWFSEAGIYWSEQRKEYIDKWWARPYFVIAYFISMWYFRLFIRGKCALFGCDEKHFCSYNMPEDADEWYCERCGAAGINYIVFNNKALFYGDNKLKDFILSLRGE
jgi:hypothetical protein